MASGFTPKTKKNQQSNRLIFTNKNNNNRVRNITFTKERYVIQYAKFDFNINAKPDMIDIKIGKLSDSDDYCGKLYFYARDPTNVVIHTFTFDSDCLHTGNTLNNSIKGTNYLMNTIKRFVLKYLPSVKTLSLVDASKFICKANKTYTKRNQLYKNIGINLYDYYLCKYGSSYYEKNFGFQLVDELHIRTHQRNIEIVEQIRLDAAFLERFRDYIASEPTHHNEIKNFDDFVAEITVGDTLKHIISSIKITDNNCVILMMLFEFCRSENPEFVFMKGANYKLVIKE